MFQGHRKLGPHTLHMGWIKIFFSCHKAVSVQQQETKDILSFKQQIKSQ